MSARQGRTLDRPVFCRRKVRLKNRLKSLKFEKWMSYARHRDESHNHEELEKA